MAPHPKGDTPMSSAADTLRDHLADIARRATAHNSGQTVWGYGWTDDDTFLIHMSSWPRANEAIKALTAEGFVAEHRTEPMDDQVLVRVRRPIDADPDDRRALIERAAIAAFIAFGHDVERKPTIDDWFDAPEEFRVTFRMVADAVLMIAEGSSHGH
jgi:hypothetical protein